MTRVKPMTRTRAGRAIKLPIRKRIKVLEQRTNEATKATQTPKVIDKMINIPPMSPILDTELYLKPLMLGDESSDSADSTSLSKKGAPKKELHTSLSDRWPISLEPSQINDPLCAEFFGKPGCIRGEERTI